MKEESKRRGAQQGRKATKLVLLVPLPHSHGRAERIFSEEQELPTPQLPQAVGCSWLSVVALLGEAQCSGKIVVDDASVDCPRGAVAVGGISMQ